MDIESFFSTILTPLIVPLNAAFDYKEDELYNKYCPEGLETWNVSMCKICDTKAVVKATGKCTQCNYLPHTRVS